MAVPTQKKLEFSGSPLTGSEMLDEVIAMLKSMVAFREGSSAPNDVQEGEYWAYDGTSPYVDIRRRMADGSDLTVLRIDKDDFKVTLMNLTDISVADGGTGASTASGARSNLGLKSAAEKEIGKNIGNVPDYEDDGDGNAVIRPPNIDKEAGGLAQYEDDGSGGAMLESPKGFFMPSIFSSRPAVHFDIDNSLSIATIPANSSWEERIGTLPGSVDGSRSNYRMFLLDAYPAEPDGAGDYEVHKNGCDPEVQSGDDVVVAFIYSKQKFYETGTTIEYYLKMINFSDEEREVYYKYWDSEYNEDGELR